MKQLIHKKQINRMTEAKFSQNDVVIVQDGEMVILDKTEILELAQIIRNEILDNQYYSRKRKGVINYGQATNN